MNLATYDSLIQTWYHWGHFVALAVAAGAAFWVFYNAANQGDRAAIWKTLTVACIILVLPSLVLGMFPTLSTGTLSSVVTPLAYVGLGATALAVLSLFFYMARVGVGPAITYCPACGQPQHPLWDYCPYCAQMQTQQAAAAVLPPSPPPAPPPPTVPASPQLFEVPELKEEKTELLRQAELQQLAWLVCMSGVHQGKEFRLRETTTIGRDPARNDVVVDDSAVSRQHAKVKMEEGQFVLYDLASSSGTFAMDKETGKWVEVHKHALKDGDQVKMGREVLHFIQVIEEQD